MERFSFGRYCRRLLSALMAMVIVAGIPVFDGAGTMSAQTKTSSAKKKKSNSSGAKKTTSSNRKNVSGNGNGSKTRKKSSTAKKQTLQGKSGSTQSRRRADKSRGKKSSSGQTAAPKSSEEARRMQEAAQRDIQQTKEKLRLNDQEIKTGLSDLNRLSSEIALGKTQVFGLQKKVTALNNDIARLGDEISKNEKELKLMRAEYLKAVKKMRLTKRNQSTLAFIFASENFNQAVRRIRYMRQFSAWKERKSSDISNKITHLGKERESLARAKDAQTHALGELTRSQEQLEANHRKQSQLVATLRHNGDALQQHLVAKQKEANRLKETISSLIAAEQAKAEAERKAREKAEAERKAKAEAERIAREKATAEKELAERAAAEKAAAGKEAAENAKAYKKAQEEKEKADRKFAEAKAKADEKARKEQEKLDKKKLKNSERTARKKGDRRLKNSVEVRESANTADAVAVTTPVNFASLRGSLPRPVDGGWRITNPFGRHAMPEMPEIEYDNPGIDAEVATGATVKSVCGGKVSGVYKVAGYGTVVIVNHGEYYTVYGNLASTNVTVGTQVGSGHSLGTAGSDPDDPRHGSVHFEVWKGREKQNPSSWIR